MPAGFLRVAPDGTGKLVRTRQRVVGTDTVQEQYVIALPSEAVSINRGWLSTLRIPTVASQAAGASQNLFSIWNGIATGGNNISIRRLSVEIDAVSPFTLASPDPRMFRMSTQAGTPGGTVITPVNQYLAEPAINSLVSIRANHQADGANATTALAFGTLGAQVLWSQTVPKLFTEVGYQSLTEYNMIPNDSALMSVDPLILRPQEGLAIQFYTPAALPATAAMWTFMFKVVLAEFTYP